jgi:uncharacterized coiled-coil DUF342 family protein
MPNKKGASTNVRAAVSKQLSQLRNKVDELRARLDAEIKRRKIDGNLLQEAKKARDQVAGELRVLRQQAAKGATELKKALTMPSGASRLARPPQRGSSNSRPRSRRKPPSSNRGPSN